jgi:succinate-semialdehyde dehydrogenase/glutarate-semialdehyde dehydrogenase
LSPGSASRIGTGSIRINIASSISVVLSFGGVKRSGYGRELPGAGISELVNPKIQEAGD